MLVRETQGLKDGGHAPGEAIQHLRRRYGAKAPSIPTVRRYYDVDGVPEDPHARTAREKVSGRPPFRDAVVEILESDPGCHMSSAYDAPVERHADSGEFDSLPGDEQAPRNFIHSPRGSGAAPEEKREGGPTVRLLCPLLRRSRCLDVHAQDHKLDSAETCTATYRFPCKIGGRAEEPVIDQDGVSVASEGCGGAVEAQVLGDFPTERQVGLRACDRAGPESRGAVESLVKLMKSSCFSARAITSTPQVRDTPPAWVGRKNRRIHQATLKTPGDVLERVGQAALRPPLPSVHEASPTSLIKVPVGPRPLMRHKGARCSVPLGMRFHDARHKAIGPKLHVCGEDCRHACAHEMSPVKGSSNGLEEHEGEGPGERLDIAERLREKWRRARLQHFVDGSKKESPRHLAKQLRAAGSFLDSGQPDRAPVASVMAQRCADWRYRLTQSR